MKKIRIVFDGVEMQQLESLILDFMQIEFERDEAEEDLVKLVLTGFYYTNAGKFSFISNKNPIRFSPAELKAVIMTLNYYGGTQPNVVEALYFNLQTQVKDSLKKTSRNDLPFYRTFTLALGQ